MKRSTSSAVIRHLLACDLGAASRGSVAGVLGMSESNLHRRLTAEGTRYQVLLDKVRLHKLRRAVRIARRPYAKVVCDSLGFQTAGSFLDFYKRRTGASYSEALRTGQI